MPLGINLNEEMPKVSLSHKYVVEQGPDTRGDQREQNRIYERQLFHIPKRDRAELFFVP